MFALHRNGLQTYHMTPFMNMRSRSAHATCFVVPSPYLIRAKRSLRNFHFNYTTLQSNVVLGGSSGVGLEIVKYLKSSGSSVESLSRSNGYDFSSREQTKSALISETGSVAVCIGGGTQRIPMEEEIFLFRNVVDALHVAQKVKLVVAVVRSLILPEVQEAFSSKLKVPWVLLRPGPLVDFRDTADSTTPRERLLVTSDIRCNGLVSRRGVARVAGDMILEKIPIPEVSTQVFGVYDEERMISMPAKCHFIGTELWGNAKH